MQLYYTIPKDIGNHNIMYKRIFLMNPPSGLYRRDDRCQSKVEDQTVRVVFPPVELGVLASIAREAGAQVALKDYPTVGATRSDYIADIQAFEPDFILLNTTVHTLAEDLEAFSIARMVGKSDGGQKGLGV